MSLSNYEVLSEYLSYLQSKFGVHICLHDFVGFIPMDKELDQTLQPFMAHINPFCMYIKSDINLMQKCLAMKKKLYDKCKKASGPFFGLCHAGSGELIYPITYNNHLIGILNVGIFYEYLPIANYLVERTCKNSQLDVNKAASLFTQSTVERFSQSAEKELHIHLNFLCSYLSNCFDKLSANYNLGELLKRSHNSSEDFILSHCLQYIKSNYINSITIASLQALCNCSESYINHLFKRRTGKSVKSYVNTLRINEAKNLLSTTCESISFISSKVGFSDPDYFSRVFSKLTGISPKTYRNRFIR